MRLDKVFARLHGAEGETVSQHGSFGLIPSSEAAIQDSLGLFEDPDAAAVCGNIMRFSKGLQVFDFAWCARNESHASVSDIKF